ncbi:MAG: tetratricopeptide repeat protein [Bacteroidia bacterium]|nr:tetratricopeptide repeat protein [Bacteroidia bacterium]
MGKSFCILFFFILNLIQTNSYAQDKTVDSLKIALKLAKHDTTRCSLLDKIILTDFTRKEWPACTDQLLALTEKNFVEEKNAVLKKFYLRYLAKALEHMGTRVYYNGQIPEAISFFTKSLKLKEQAGDKAEIAVTLNSFGQACFELGDISKTLHYFERSLKLREELNEKRGIAESLNNIGTIYINQNEHEQALKYMQKSIAIWNDLNDKVGLGAALGNIAVIYAKEANYVKAIEYYEKSLTIAEQIQDPTGIANRLTNIAVVYQKQKNYNKSLEYYLRSLKLREQMGDKLATVNSINNIAALLLEKGALKEALEYGKRTLKMAKEIGYPDNIRKVARTLKFIYKKQNNYTDALAMYKLEIQMLDSLESQQNKSANIKSLLKYEYEKKSAADSVKNSEGQKVKDAQLKAQTASLRQEKAERYSLVIGLVIVLGGLGFVVNRFRLTNKQKKIIEQQKLSVDEAFNKLNEKNKEVLSSIHYAKRIQTALLPSEKLIERNLKRLRSLKK